MRFKWGKTSEDRIATLDPRLRCVIRKALGFDVMDITVLSGLRHIEEQQRLVDEELSQKLDSKHLANEAGWSEALDAAPYPIDWSDTGRFYIMAGLMFAAASELGVKIRWGGDWDSDMNIKEEKFKDLGHFEVIDE